VTEQRAKRKLAAILSADVKGYSLLMADDEEATVRTINSYREVMTGIINGHAGRVVDAKGDNVLAEFSSVVDAVRCAIEVQKGLEERNADLPEHRRMAFRIGINLGDVIEEEGTIYGDGVNVAARLEGLAEEGGICISGTAFDHLKNKLAAGYQYLGKQRVKNIPDPVRAYKVLLEPEAVGKVMGEEEPKLKKWVWKAIAGTIVLLLVAGGLIWSFYFHGPQDEPASAKRMAFPLPDKPSIAVLPFVNMSDDPEQEYFSDGITEEIITALSKVEKLFVIARNSTFTYKGRPIKVQQVGRELGVKYVLEGSVRRSADKIRITAQLVEAQTGHHVWAERYDRALEDIFALQDDISKNILTSLQVKLTEGEKVRVWSRATHNLNAYQRYLQGRAHFLLMNRDDNVISRRLFEEAVALDGEFASAYADLAWTYLMDVHFGVSISPKESLRKADELAQKTISLGSSSMSQTLLGSISMARRKYEEAIAYMEKAVAFSPNDSLAQAHLGRCLLYSGKCEEALEYFEKAIRLDPIPPNWYSIGVGACYQHMGRYEDAVEEFKKVIHRNPDDLIAHIRLASTYSLLGREEDAGMEAKEVLRLAPRFSVGHIAKTWPYRNSADTDLIVNALRKAGLPG
jgi:adenylate cyclase